MLQKRNNFHAELRKTANVFHTPPLSFYASQIIIPFLNSRTSANHDKVDGLSANGEIFIRGLFLYCRISLLMPCYSRLDILDMMLRSTQIIHLSKEINKNNLIMKFKQSENIYFLDWKLN